MHEIRVITRGRDLLKIGPKAFRDFIAPFVKERSSLTVQKVPTLAQERLWLKQKVNWMDKGNLLYVLLISDGRLAGNCEARRAELYGERFNVHFGLVISKPCRGQGWGEKLLRTAIKQSRRRFKPHRMWIEHVEGNTPARRLYQKVGFVKVGRLDGYENHYGAYKDKILMQYKPGRKSQRR